MRCQRGSQTMLVNGLMRGAADLLPVSFSLGALARFHNVARIHRQLGSFVLLD